MPYRVTAIETTPNPNAVKCLVEPSPGPVPRSYFRPEQVDPKDDPLAAELFAIDGVASILIHTAFISVNKAPDAAWGSIKAAIKAVLARHG